GVSLRRARGGAVGPYYSIGLCRRAENELVPRDDPRALALTGRLLDGGDEPIPDGLVELWDPAARLWGRCGTEPEGAFSFVLARPRPEAVGPPLAVFVFAPGLL